MALSVRRAIMYVSYFMFVILFIVFLVLYIRERNGCEDVNITRDVPQGSKYQFGSSTGNWIPPEHASSTLSKDHRNQKFNVPDNLQQLEQQARQNFTLSRIDYAAKCLKNTEKPFLTIVTRTKGSERVNELSRNRMMLAHMIDKDFEHVILHDHNDSGMQVAEASLYAFQDEFRGQYICHWDDDDYVTNFDFVSEMKYVVEKYKNPKVIMYRVYHEPTNQTLPLHWKTFPKEGEITTSNFLIARELYHERKNLGVIAQSWAGDYAFIHNVLIDCNDLEVCWVNEVFGYISDHKNNNNNTFPTTPYPLMHTEYVTTELNGGLGNQMFEIATAYAYARTHGKKLVLDQSQEKVSLKSDNPRSTYWSTMFAWTSNNNEDACFDNTYSEKRFNYDCIPFYYGSVMLKGYFQSSQYFHAYRQELLNFFMTSSKVQKTPRDMSNTISVHIRRTDYVNHAVHTQQTSQYYQDAVAYVEANKKNKQHNKQILQLCTLIVFSDDVKWCQKHLPGWFPEHDIVYATDFKDNNPHLSGEEKDLWLMTQCSHHVIANSSFSWWGAYLHQQEQETDFITVAPQQWFSQDIDEWSDVYHTGWHTL